MTMTVDGHGGGGAADGGDAKLFNKPRKNKARQRQRKGRVLSADDEFAANVLSARYEASLKTFQKYEHEENPGFLRPNGLREALDELGVKVGERTEEELLREMDLDGAGTLTYEDFQKFLLAGPAAHFDATSWLRNSVPVCKIIGQALMRTVSEKIGTERMVRGMALEDMYDLSHAEVRQVISDLIEPLTEAISESLERLKAPQDDLSTQSGESGGKYACSRNDLKVGFYGSVDKFRSGVVGLVGRPDPELLVAMQREHCHSADSLETFEVLNNGKIVTTPALEWEFCAGTNAVAEDGSFNMESAPDMTKVYPGEDREDEDREGRNKFALKEFLDRGPVREARLKPEEVLGLRLYTGPMYYKYNRVLRNRQAQAQGDGDAVQGNRYSTTIHLIVSGIVKLSLVSKLPSDRRVFRGLKGLVLPECFWKGDKSGCRGGVELGMMSTTTHKSVALSYCGHSGTTRTIFEVEVGKIDMGADVRCISQYPAEEEILFPPLTFLEVLGTPHYDDGICVVRLRPNVNLKSQTIEEILGERKAMLISMADKLTWETEHLARRALVPMRPLPAHIQTLTERIDRQIKARDASWFNNTEKYRQATLSLFDLFQEAVQLTADASERRARELRERGELAEATAVLKGAVTTLKEVADSKEQREQAVRWLRELLAMLRAQQGQESRRESAATSLKLGKELYYLARYKEALEVYGSAVALYEQSEGRLSKGVGEALHGSGICLWRLGQAAPAMAHLRSALQVQETALGREQADTARTLFRMGDVMEGQGSYQEALTAYGQAVEIQERVLGKDDLDTVRTRDNIGLVYLRQGKHREALQIFEETLHLKIKHLGLAHPSVGTTLSNKAFAHGKLGDPEKAQQLYLEVLKTAEKALGRIHPNVARTLQDMGRMLIENSRGAEAVSLLKEASHIQSEFLGPEHQDTLTSLDLLQRCNQTASSASADAHGDARASPANSPARRGSGGVREDEETRKRYEWAAARVAHRQSRRDLDLVAPSTSVVCAPPQHRGPRTVEASPRTILVGQDSQLALVQGDGRGPTAGCTDTESKEAQDGRAVEDGASANRKSGILTRLSGKDGSAVCAVS